MVAKLEVLESELSEKHQALGEQLEIVRHALAEARAVAERGTTVGSSDGEGTRPDDVAPADEGFMVPEIDEATGEPIYEKRAVLGFETIRERVHAAARVYGRRLREVSLARAIFQTGETSAPDEKSARWSLGSVARHDDQWHREKGWLVYQGVVTPNAGLIREMYEEIAGGPEYLDRPEFDGELERGERNGP